MMSFALLAIVKPTLVCGVAFLLSRLCRRARASIRHLLFALAFTALVVIPAAGPALPTVVVTIPAPVTAPSGTENKVSAVLSTARVDASESGTPSRDLAPARFVTIAQLVVATWLMGVALFLIPVGIGFWQLRRLRQAALPWTGGQALVQALAPTLGVHRRIDALLHKTVTGPMTCGVLKPAIILPASAPQWDEAALRCALTHELEHVARWDFLTHCLSRIVCAAYWFHPLVWAAWRQLRLEAERACDDAAVREDDATDYASLLMFIAQREPAGARQPYLSMAGHDDLAARVAAVLDDHQARGRIGRRRAAGLIATGAIAILGVGPITVARDISHTEAAGTAAPWLTFETVSLRRSQDAGKSSMQVTEEEGGKPGVGLDGRVQWLTATNVTARSLLWHAYEFRELHQIDNAPEWLDSDRFDLVAKAPSRATPQEVREMLRSFLAERFKLEAHHGSKEFPIYALILTGQDGRTGPRMTASQVDCRSRPGESSACGLSGTAGRLAGRGMTMAQLAGMLARHLAAGSQIRFDRRVIDRTGLSGAFDFTLEWTPDRVRGDLVYPFPLASNASNFLAALEEQLGLRLDDELAPEPVLVIDRIEPPIEN
jgi:uncharacterized protein (TIGR03435 family)